MTASLLANVMFPAFHAAWMPILSPLILLVLTVETGVLWSLNRSLSFLLALGCVVAMNAVSYLAGFLVSPLMFNPWRADVDHLYGTQIGQEVFVYSLYSLAVAFVLSWMIEACAVFPFRKRLGIARAGRSIGLANLASYVCLFLVLRVWFS